MITRLVLGWLRDRLSMATLVQRATRHTDAVDDRARLATAAWLATQHYVRGDLDQFDAAIQQAEPLMRGQPRGLQDDSFLIRVLKANALAVRNKPEAAAEIYRDLIEQQRALTRSASRSPQPEERRHAMFHNGLVALLECNLATALEAAGKDDAEIRRHFQAARDAEPHLRYVLDTYANILTKWRLWDEAQAALEEAHRLEPTAKDADQRRSSALASLASRRADALEAAHKPDQAIAVVEEALHKHGPTADPGWNGALLYQLGKLYEMQGRNEEAVREFAKAASIFAAIASSAGRVIEGYVRYRQGDRLSLLRRDEEALEAWSAALEATYRIPDPKKRDSFDINKVRRSLLARIGAMRLVRGDPGKGKEALDAWRAIAGLHAPWAAYELLVPDLGMLEPLPEVRDALQRYLQELIAHTASIEERRLQLDGVRALWDRHLWGERSEGPTDLWSPERPLVAKLNVTLPLVLEMEGTMVDAIGSDAIVVGVDKLRDRIRNRFGVIMPGLRVYRHPGPIPGSYEIIIHGQPRATGTLSSGGAVVDAPSAPPTSTPLDLVMAHLETVVVANLAEIVGHQEVQMLLESHHVVTPGQWHRIITTETAEHMDPLTKVVRGLVAERVPVVEFPVIHQRFEELHRAGHRPDEIVETLRADPRIRDRLWGNDGTYEVMRIGPRLQAAIDAATRRTPQPVLVLDRVQLQNLLDAVRPAMTSARRPALVAMKPLQRPLLRALVSREFPEVPVLSFAELGENALRARIAILDLPEPRRPP